MHAVVVKVTLNDEEAAQKAHDLFKVQQFYVEHLPAAQDEWKPES